MELTCLAYKKTAFVEPSSPQLVVGRDPKSTVHLPDPERSISRRHLALDWTAEGVKVTVLSTVNSVSTADGDIFTGQHAILRIGNSARFGAFTLTIAGTTKSAARSHTTSLIDTPFDYFGDVESSSMSVFDDPFFQPAPQSSVYKSISSGEIFDEFEQNNNKEDIIHSKSKLTRSKEFNTDSYQKIPTIVEPISGFLLGDKEIISPSSSIDSFLGSSSNGLGGLGASTLLISKNLQSHRKLAVDHVHDFNLPFHSKIYQSTPNSVQPSVQNIKASESSLNNPINSVHTSIPLSPVDPWADIQSNWPTSPKEHKSTDDESEPKENPIESVMLSSLKEEASPFDDMWTDMPEWPRSISDDDQLNHLQIHSETAHSLSDDQSPLQQKIPANNAGEVLSQISDLSSSGRFLPPANISQTALLEFCKGLGIDSPNQLDDANWEQMGQAVRSIVGGLTGLLKVRTELKRELRAADRTMLASHDNNPLKSEISLDEALQYVLFNPTGIGGYMPANLALDEAIRDLQAHEFAAVAASRAAVEGSLKEFSPEKLRSVLINGKSKLPQFLDNARLWDIYTQYYHQKSQHMADWLEDIFNLHFIPTYSRECERFRIIRHV